jgi:hypothetical protein
MKLVRKLLLALSAMTFAGVTLITSTYAWFKVNSKATVSGFDFGVTSGFGFKISIDGRNFKQNITTEEMLKAIALGHDSTNYISEDGTLLNSYGLELNPNTYLQDNSIALKPVTSKDGQIFKALAGGTVGADNGEFIEFTIYFKAVSDGDESDKSIYSIYLCEDDTIIKTGEKATADTPEKDKVRGTYIKSNLNVIEAADDGSGGLLAPMKIYDKVIGEVRSLGKGETIRVYTTNSLRISAHDEDLISDANIYEIIQEDDLSVQDFKGGYDLGSYATNYGSVNEYGRTEEEIASQTDEDLMSLYCCDNNAGFIYYNNLRPSSKIEPLNYTDPENELILNEENRLLSPSRTMTQVSSTSGVKRIKFRIWMEGYDADCFDGLTESVSVHLLFNSVKRYS